MTNEKKKATIDDVVNKSADEIIQYFQSHTTADFKTRMEKFEEFHHPEHQIPEIFGQHVEQVIRGNPENREKFPGAYDVAYKKLGSIVKGRFDKVEKRDDVVAILEAYVDQFLAKAHGDKLATALEHAKAEGLTPEEIRRMKGVLFSMYHPPDQRTGRRIQPFNEEFIKGLVGKTRLQMEQQLRGFAANSAAAYGQYLVGRATEGLIKEEDQFEMAKYVGPKFKSAGFKHPDHPLTRTVDDLVADYSTLITGGNIQERGYQRLSEKPEAKKS